jgi:hypothetical protein
MNKLKSAITKPWWKAYSRFRGKNLVQTREQTITHLLWFYLVSVSLAFFSAVIQVWGIPAQWGMSGAAKDILGPLSAAIAVKLSYDFIRDVIATEFDAATKKLEDEVNARLLEDIKEIREKIDNSHIKQSLDVKYLAYLKQTLGAEKLHLQEVSSSLKEEYSENRSEFENKLDKDFEDSRKIREVRCIIHELTEEFLQQLAVKGIADALGLEIKEANERTNSGNDLCSLRVDVYAYLSAWLICSIDNDIGLLMPIQPIGMRYTRGSNIPDKETYKNVIKAIEKIIVDGRYKTFKYYPDSDPLSSRSLKSTIINYLDKIIDLIEKYPLEAVKS